MARPAPAPCVRCRGVVANESFSLPTGKIFVDEVECDRCGEQVCAGCSSQSTDDRSEDWVVRTRTCRPTCPSLEPPPAPPTTRVTLVAPPGFRPRTASGDGPDQTARMRSP